MPKPDPKDTQLVEQLVAAIKEGWKVGDFTPSDLDSLVPLIIRRWRSFSRRGIDADDKESRIRDMAKLIGPDRLLYRRAAERIVAVLESQSE